MASAAALAYLPPSTVGGEEGWPWALLGITSVGTMELILPFLILCWLIAEVLFFFVMRFLHDRLDKLTPPERSNHDPEEYVIKVMDIVDSVRGVYPFETFLTRWCGSETIDELKKGNVAQFLAWALLSERVENLLPRDFTMIMRMVEMVNERFELNLESGINTDVRTLRMTLEPLEVIHRPLCMYVAVTYIPRLLGNGCLRLQGFVRLEHEGLGYWYRPSREWPGKLPLVFFHGVSPGQCAYAGLTTLLSEGRSAVLIEIPHIAMSLEEFRAKTEEEVTEAVRAICQRHQIQRFVVAGHSYGTIWAGWVVRALRKEVMQAVLLDPVCILLCLPNTPFNFLYRKPQDPPSHVCHAPSLFSYEGIKKHVFDYGLHYVVSRELTIANAMRRQFWWHKKILHAEDIHCPCIVGLASDDILLSAPAIKKYLEDSVAGTDRDMRIVWWQDFSHGELLTSMPSQQALDEMIREQEQSHYHANGARPIWEYPQEQAPNFASLRPGSAAGGMGGGLTPKRSRSRTRLVREISHGSAGSGQSGLYESSQHHQHQHHPHPLSPASSFSSTGKTKTTTQRKAKRQTAQEILLAYATPLASTSTSLSVTSSSSISLSSSTPSSPRSSPHPPPTHHHNHNSSLASSPLPLPVVSGAGDNQGLPNGHTHTHTHAYTHHRRPRPTGSKQEPRLAEMGQEGWWSLAEREAAREKEREKGERRERREAREGKEGRAAAAATAPNTSSPHKESKLGLSSREASQSDPSGLLSESVSSRKVCNGVVDEREMAAAAATEGGGGGTEKGGGEVGASPPSSSSWTRTLVSAVWG